MRKLLIQNGIMNLFRMVMNNTVSSNDLKDRSRVSADLKIKINSDKIWMNLQGKTLLLFAIGGAMPQHTC